MATTIILDFILIDCTPCGSKERVAGSPCPDCGGKGRADEVNGLVVRREQGVRAVQALVAESAIGETEVLPFFRAHAS
jgi:DnaJ-class molecular chaperone